jgi:hypothetical protein
MRIAICISGQPRNFKQSYVSLKKYFLDKHDCDIYFHSWKTPSFESTNFGGGNHQYQLNEEDYNELVELYQPKNYILEQPIVFDASGYQCPIWRQPLNNTLSMFYSIYKSFQLIEGEYDYVVRTRFDLDHSLFNLEFSENNINIPEWNTDLNVKHRGFYDVFAFGPQPLMKTYSEVFSNVISYVTNDPYMFEFLQGGWPGQDSPLRNEYLLKWHLVKNNIAVTELPTTEKRADVGLIR